MKRRFITVDGCTQQLKAWVKLSPVSKTTITKRLDKGWLPREAIFAGPEKPKIFPVQHYQELSKKSHSRKNKKSGGPKISLEKKVKLFFLSRPSVSNRDVARELKIDERTVAKYRDPSSIRTKINKKRFIHILFVIGEQKAAEALKYKKDRAKHVRLFQLIRSNLSIPVAAERIGVPRRVAYGWVYRVLEFWQHLPEQRELRG